MSVREIHGIPALRERPPGFASTDITNEQTRAINTITPSIVIGQVDEPPLISPWKVFVRNDTLSSVSEGGVLGIDGTVATAGSDEFRQRIIFTGSAPALANHLGRFVIAAEDIPAGAIGRCYVDGICPAKVNFANADERWADVAAANTTNLVANGHGGAYVVNPAPGTGTQWVYVRLSMENPRMVPVTCTQTGGSAGNSTTPPSYTYSIYDVHSGELIATSVAVTGNAQRLLNAAVTSAATRGIAYRVVGTTTWNLIWCDEKFTQNNC